MSPALAVKILEFTFEADKPLYRGTLNTVAEAKKVRPVFLERKPRAERNLEVVAMLGKPHMEPAAATLLRGWLMKQHQAMLVDFLDALRVPHSGGAVDNLPATMEDPTLNAAIEKLLAKYPREEVVVYLNAFYSMNEVAWENLKSLLEKDPRLQF